MERRGPLGGRTQRNLGPALHPRTDHRLGWRGSLANQTSHEEKPTKLRNVRVYRLSGQIALEVRNASERKIAGDVDQHEIDQQDEGPARVVSNHRALVAHEFRGRCTDRAADDLLGTKKFLGLTASCSFLKSELAKEFRVARARISQLVRHTT